VERTFADWVDLKRQFQIWSREYANQRTHGITKRIPHEAFLAEERTTLQPLPSTPFTHFERFERKVQSNCHVFFKNNYYSAPSKLVGQIVTLRTGGNILKISFKGEEVACHLLTTATGTYITCRSHLPTFKCYSQTEYQQKYEAKMADIGEWAHTYFKQILLNQDHYWFRSVRSILGLAQDHGAEAVNLSLKRALTYHVTQTAAIKKIVIDRLYELEPPPKLLARTTAISPQSAILSLDRDLSYYQAILGS
jgi:hypothetical protein